MSSLYVDSSAWIKRYLREPESDECIATMERHGSWFVARHALVEVTRVLARDASERDARRLEVAFDADLMHAHVIELDRLTCAMAADVARTTGARTPDALHLGAALRVGDLRPTVLTYDVRMADAAEALGLAVTPSR